MNKWMNEWINEWMKEWMNEWMNAWMSERKYEWMNDEWTNGQTKEKKS